MSITLQGHLTTHNHMGLVKSMSKLSRTCFLRLRRRKRLVQMFNDTLQCSIVKQLMQILSNRSASSDLSMSKSARKQLGIDCEDSRNKYKNEHLPPHGLHIDQAVTYQDSTSKWWYPATITRLCKKPRSYTIKTKEDVHYRKTQAHLKPYQLQSKKSEDEHLSQSNHMWTVKNESKRPHIIDNLVQSRPKRDIKPPVKLDL